MLKKVQATYFIKILFSHIFKRKKLQIVKYNKNLQSIINRSLLYYKAVSEKYLVYYQEGLVKEYDLDSLDDYDLIYDGQYLNGKRHGKGKEYDEETGKIIFQGNI